MVPIEKLSVIYSQVARSHEFLPYISPSSGRTFIQTKIKNIDNSQYLGMEYFFFRANLDDWRDAFLRAGDSYFEYRLVREQMFVLTGCRALIDGADAQAEMQALYNNAADMLTKIDLQIGVPLRPGDVARLTQDIVWPEQITIGGHAVVFPRLYLAISPQSERHDGRSTYDCGSD